MIIRVEEFKSNVCELSEELFDKITKTMFGGNLIKSKLKFKEYYNKQIHSKKFNDTMFIFVSKVFLGMSMRTIGCSILIIVSSFS